MIADPRDTIAAIASPPGAAARGIVRLSGPAAIECVGILWHPNDKEGANPADLSCPATLAGTLRVDGFASAVPCQLYIWPTARSYTRKPVVEIHTIGSPPVLEALMQTVCRHGARLAGPGEFTLRAFLAGRLDLTEAEAVLGVIDAGDRRQLDVALEQLAGGLAVPLRTLRDELLDVLAHLEAGLDFVEEDIEFISRAALGAQIAAAADVVGALAEQTATRSVLRDAVRVVLVGSPNVGKSSLFNALVGQPGAIVSPVAGTTRDYLLGELNIDGLQIELVDTAGNSAFQREIEGSAATGETSGIDQAAQQAMLSAREQAAVELLCLDATRTPNDWERDQLTSPAHRPRIVVLTKCDQRRATDSLPTVVETSSATGQGLNQLREQIRVLATENAGQPERVVVATATRCHNSLRAAADALAQALALVEDATGEELVAAELRAALDELGQVVGAVYTDDLLDRIFSRFCIGK